MAHQSFSEPGAQRSRLRSTLVAAGLFASVLGVVAAPAAAVKPKSAPAKARAAGHDAILGIWQASGDFESSVAAFPGGGEGVGWAPLSNGSPEERLAKAPSKEQRFAAAEANLARLSVSAQGSDEDRLGAQNTQPLPAASPQGLKNYAEIAKAVNFKFEQERCAGVNVVSGVASSNFIIARNAQGYLISYETGFSRMVYTDGRDASAVFPSMLGFSVGHWEGDTLVIKTDHITASGHWMSGGGMRNGWPLSDDVTLTEWIKILPDGRISVKRQFNDPMNYTQPFASLSISEKAPDGIIMSPCIETLADQPFFKVNDANNLDKKVNESIAGSPAK